MLQGGALFASLTNMGGFMQPQGHVQLVVNMVDYGMEPQARSTDETGLALPDGGDGTVGVQRASTHQVAHDRTRRLTPQAAIDAPRFCIDGANTDEPHAQPQVFLEEGIGADTAEQLRRMGHTIAHDISGHDRDTFGRAQIIQRLPTGVLWGGSDGRSDGMAIGW